MSVDQDVSVDVDLEANNAEVRLVSTERVELGEVFDENGELRLWEDSAGWSGFVVVDDAYYEVNILHDDEEPIAKRRVTAEEVADAVAGHFADPLAGGRGNFERRCSPP